MKYQTSGLTPHEFIRVKIGGHLYDFRTLSWAQLLTGQQALKTLSRQLLPLQAKKPEEITEADNAAITPALEAVFNIICPELSMINESCSCDVAEPHPDYMHLDENPNVIKSLFAFYLRQDWKKVKEFIDAGDDLEKEMTPDEAKDMIATIGRMVSAFQNIDRLAFNDLRFEEAIDLINQSHREWDEKAGESGKLRVKQFLDRSAALGVGDIGESQPLNFGPGFFEMFSKPEN